MFSTQLRIAGGLVFALSIAVVAHLCGTAAAQSSGKGSKKPQVIEVDLSKLPPELAQQIRDSLRKTSHQSKSATKKAAAKPDSQDEGQSGFQGEQTGEHEDGKTKPAAKKGRPKEDQSGQNEDRERTKKKKKKSDD